VIHFYISSAHIIFCAIMPKRLQCRTFEWVACRKSMVSAGLPGAIVKYNVATFYGYLEYHWGLAKFIIEQVTLRLTRIKDWWNFKIEKSGDLVLI
jgi:hypothetical protein